MSARPSLRPWYFAGKRWTSPSRLEVLLEGGVPASWGLVHDRESKVDGPIDVASVVMWALCQTITVRKELSQETNLSIYQVVYIPTLRSQCHLTKISFFLRISGLSSSSFLVHMSYGLGTPWYPQEEPEGSKECVYSV